DREPGLAQVPGQPLGGPAHVAVPGRVSGDRRDGQPLPERGEEPRRVAVDVLTDVHAGGLPPRAGYVPNSSGVCPAPVLAARGGPLERAAFPPRSFGAPSSRRSRSSVQAARRPATSECCWLRRPAQLATGTSSISAVRPSRSRRSAGRTVTSWRT